MEQPAQNPAHEQHRDKHSGQRQGHGKDGEANFARAVQGGSQRRFSGFHVSDDVLQHHNGVVHHETHGQRQCHQREVIHAVAEQIHDRKGADDGQGQRQARNDGGRKVAQEQEDDQDHQANGQQQRGLNIANRFADGLRPIIQDVERDAGWNLRTKGGQHLRNFVHHFDGVNTRLALDSQHDAPGVVKPTRYFVVLDAVDHAANLFQANRAAPAVSHDERAVIGGLHQLAVGLDDEGLAFSVKRAGGQIHVPLADGRFNFINANAPASQGVRVNLDVDGIGLSAEDEDLGDTVDH